MHVFRQRLEGSKKIKRMWIFVVLCQLMQKYLKCHKEGRKYICKKIF